MTYRHRTFFAELNNALVKRILQELKLNPSPVRKQRRDNTVHCDLARVKKSTSAGKNRKCMFPVQKCPHLRGRASIAWDTSTAVSTTEFSGLRGWIPNRRSLKYKQAALTIKKIVLIFYDSQLCNSKSKNATCSYIAELRIIKTVSLLTVSLAFCFSSQYYPT